MKRKLILQILLVAFVVAAGPVPAADWRWEKAISAFEAADKTNPPPPTRWSSKDKPNLTFIDSHTKLLGHTGQPRPEILADGLHLNSQGYREFAAIVKPQILA